MTGSDTLGRLIHILRDGIDVKGELSADTALLRDLGMDSLDFTNYITQVESEFGVTISDDDIKNHQLGVMRNMVSYLDKQKAPKP